MLLHEQLNYFYSIIKLSWNIPLPWKPFPHIHIILSYYDNVVILICTNQKHQFQGDLTYNSYFGFGFKFYVDTRKVKIDGLNMRVILTMIRIKHHVEKESNISWIIQVTLILESWLYISKADISFFCEGGVYILYFTICYETSTCKIG